KKRCVCADVSSAKEGAPREHQAQIHTLTLKPLAQRHIQQLVADTLLCTRELAAPLGELVYQKTQGNPFFATQFLQGLYEDDCITFNAEGYWQCDLAQVKQLALTDDVVEFMVGRLRKLPQATQEVLKLAACIGNQFDLNTLAIVCDRALNAATTDLWPSLQEGLVIPENETYKFFQGDGGEVTDVEDIKIGYRFLHDRVQQAAYTLIPKEEKQKIHYHIGNLLLQKIPLEEREDRIFELVSQLNHGIDLITEPQERNELAALNLMACRQARKSTAYEAGRDCGRNGLLLLGENPWQCDYDISLALHEYSAEFAFLCGDLEAMQQLVDVIVLRAKTALDKVNAYRVIIQVNTLQNQLNQAIIIARRFLQELEVMLPENPNPNDIQRAFAEIDQLMENRGLGDLAHLPIMTDEKKLAIVRITNSIMAAAYLTGSPLFPLLAALTVKISIQHGNSLDSALAYASYGVMICNLLGDINTGVSFGQLAIQVSSHPNFRPAKPEVLNVAGLWVLHRNTHIKETLPILQEGYEVGLEVGNLLYAGYNAFNFCANSFWCGQLLTELEQTIRSHCQRLEQLNQLNSANYGCIYWQSILNLRGAVEQPTILSGEALQEARILPSLLEANDSYGLFYFYLCKLILSYLFGEFESAHNHGIELRKYLKSGAGVMGIAIFYFYDSLTILRRLNKGDVANQSIQTERDEKLKQLGENQIILQQQWADFAPMNHQHKVDLIEAEKHRLLEQNLEAIELYNRAIAGAKENGFIHEVALANELAAKFYLDWGKENYAALHMQSAYYCYAKWGAKAKTEDLEKRYPDLLQPILQQAAVSINLGETFPQNTTQTSNSSVTNINNALDFSSILKASQTLSSTIELNQLLTQFTQIILHNSGGDCCALILPNVKGEWYVEAITTASETKLCYEPLENNPNLPTKLIQYVKNIEEVVVIDDLNTDLPVIDEYLLEKQPKSLLCLPLLNQGNLIGILYLNNLSTSGVFTKDRILTLNILCTQAAISLENARLYDNLEQKVQQRTKELSDTLEELKTTQNKLVESEKMAALGSLVAGVAHEINTPVGTSITVASNLAAKTEDFADNIAKGQLKRSVLNNYIEIAQKSTDLLVQNLNQAGDLVNSFKQVAVDQTNLELRHFRVKEYIEGVLLNLAPQLKQSPHKLIVSGDEDITINSYAGSFAQVITNLVINSLIHAYPEEKPGKLNFEITSEAENIKIIYSDDGCGIPEENLTKIFEPFFTTKRNQGGTGLGLHIVYNLITHKLQGSIDIDSIVGKGTTFILTIPSILN
ncbi:MAG: ATP-binding protein, partial [Cyanobacteria bacterium J06632_19]